MDRESQMKSYGCKDLFYLRPATLSDKELLFEWVNEKNVRENSFNTDLISAEEHDEWFRRVMDDVNVIIFILMKNDTPVGQCRLTVEDGVADIAYSVDSSMRGKGIGKILLELVESKVSKNMSNIIKLTGSVKANNVASMRCFESVGFSEECRVFEKEL